MSIAYPLISLLKRKIWQYFTRRSESCQMSDPLFKSWQKRTMMHKSKKTWVLFMLIWLFHLLYFLSTLWWFDFLIDTFVTISSTTRCCPKFIGILLMIFLSRHHWATVGKYCHPGCYPGSEYLHLFLAAYLLFTIGPFKWETHSTLNEELTTIKGSSETRLHKCDPMITVTS